MGVEGCWDKFADKSLGGNFEIGHKARLMYVFDIFVTNTALSVISIQDFSRSF